MKLVMPLLTFVEANAVEEDLPMDSGVTAHFRLELVLPLVEVWSRR
jgi:hypothetical protein